MQTHMFYLATALWQKRGSESSRRKYDFFQSFQCYVSVKQTVALFPAPILSADFIRKVSISRILNVNELLLESFVESFVQK